MIAMLHIQTALRENKTYLKSCFCTTPFKVANITEDKNDNILKLMLMSSSPGILDGDDYHLKIELQEGSSLELQTQSYQRLFDMKTGASQNIEVHAGNRSFFCYLPHPAVPHKASDFTAVNKIYLSENCRLIWGEVLTCGRKLNGELFKFSKYQNQTEVFLNQKLIVKENLLLRPSKINVSAIGQLEGYTHQASLIYIDTKANINEIISKITESIARQNNVCFGVSALPVNGLIVRLMGYRGEQLYNCLHMISTLFEIEIS